MVVPSRKLQSDVGQMGSDMEMNDLGSTCKLRASVSQRRGSLITITWTRERRASQGSCWRSWPEYSFKGHAGVHQLSLVFQDMRPCGAKKLIITGNLARTQKGSNGKKQDWSNSKGILQILGIQNNVQRIH